MKRQRNRISAVICFLMVAMFYFQLSARSEDGYNFTEIGKVSGTGNSNTPRSYDFIDESPASHNYYRLSQTDFNGQQTKLEIISVKLSKEGTGLDMQIQSNPVRMPEVVLTLFSSEEEDVMLAIADLQGRMLLSEKHSMVKGSKLIPVDLKGISLGTYLISATSRNSSIVRKFLFLNEQ